METMAWTVKMESLTLLVNLEVKARAEMLVQREMPEK
jgi:hypothetical protein